ncbi:unnamed protein product [Vicia faba]|uniref:RRM domain-containing protein n=1 Tax=Vicia faba TaxID=3906 RepID=A0AAV0Z873_VICFA|nr:unnamed protein product [Vicia faba]
MIGDNLHHEGGWKEAKKTNFRKKKNKVKDFFELFWCIGKIYEVVISPKRNKIGKKFGFARFTEVEDARMLAVRLDNVQIMGKKIHANVSRFERNGAEAWGRRQFVEGSVTFADVVANNKEKNHQIKKCVFSYTSKEEFRMRFMKAFVGQLAILSSADNIQASLEREGYFAIKITPLCESLCLLEESEQGVTEDFFREWDLSWKQWFMEVKRWKSEEIDIGRVAWVGVYGVPCHA